MKCVRSHEGEITRVTNEKADSLVKTNQWNFCSKQLWKENVRDVNKNDTSKKENNKKKSRRKNGKV